jgi:hypothetical protein
MNEERQGSAWNIVALIASLGLAAVVAVVAVSRSDRPGPASGESPSPSPSTSASPTAPGSLAGHGPYVVYATGAGEVVAYDTAAKQFVSMGRIDGPPVTQYPRQPGNGDIVAFATDEGTVWKVAREGLDRVALLPVSRPALLDGGAVSRDGRRLAVAYTGPDPELMIVNLTNGRTQAISREGGSSNRYPDEPLVPVGWSLGGSLVYQMPVCDCDTGSPGLYLYDLDAERSTLIPATAQDEFFQRFAVSPDGQQLLWSDVEDRPYVLRRLSAGRSGATVIRRDADQRVNAIAWAPDGRSVLLDLFEEGGGRSFELADPESGDRTRNVSGLPERVAIEALLPGRIIVAMALGGLQDTPTLV